MTGRDLATRAVEFATDKKALEPVLLDVSERSTYADYILVLSGRSDRQLGAIVEGIVDGLAKQGARPLGIEGADTPWMLIDYGDVVVHVFLHSTREFYDIEGLWFDAPRVPLEVPPESRLSAADMY